MEAPEEEEVARLRHPGMAMHFAVFCFVGTALAAVIHIQIVADEVEKARRLIA